MKHLAVAAAMLLFSGYATFMLAQTHNVPVATDPERCVIKGNINITTGRRVYYVPGHIDYLKIGISVGNGERWFCSEVEALAAGWTKSPR